MQHYITRPFLFLIVIFVVKLAELAWMTHLTRCVAPDEVVGLASLTGDYKSYIFPVENYITTGKYFIADEHHTEVIGRMPYYGLVYYAARQVMNVNASYQAVVIFQLLIESVAVLMLAMMAGFLLRRRLAVYGTLALSLISLHLTFYANLIITESLSFSLLIFFSYQYIRYLDSRAPRRLLYSAIFLAMAVSLKPYLGVLFIYIAAEQLAGHWKLSLKRMSAMLGRNALLVLLPLALWLAPWTIRNFNLLDRFEPFYDVYGGIQYDEADLSYRRFVSSWGGSIVFWDKRSAGCYFEPAPEIPCEFEFPSYVLTKTVTLQALENVRGDFILHHLDRKNDSITKLVSQKFNLLTEAYRQERPFVYYFGSHLIRLKSFLVHSGSYFLPVTAASACYHKVQLIPKAITSLLYYACLVPGFIGLLWMTRRYRGAWLLLFIPLSLVFIFPILLRATEWRYFTASYPFLLIGLVYLGCRLKDKWVSRRGAA